MDMDILQIVSHHHLGLWLIPASWVIILMLDVQSGIYLFQSIYRYFAHLLWVLHLAKCEFLYQCLFLFVLFLTAIANKSIFILKFIAHRINACKNNASQKNSFIIVGSHHTSSVLLVPVDTYKCMDNKKSSVIIGII